MDYTTISIVAALAFVLGFCTCALLTGNDKRGAESEDTLRMDFLQTEKAQVTAIDIGGSMVYGVTTKRPGLLVLGSPAPTIRQAVDSAMVSAAVAGSEAKG